MGASCSREAPGGGLARDHRFTSNNPVPVTLNVYDIGSGAGGSILNRLLKPLGTGAFHCGVEVHGQEWSYSDIEGDVRQTMSGVFACKPQQCIGHSYAQSVKMGRSSISHSEVNRLVALMESEWTVGEYDILRKNCCHFSNEFCLRIGVGPIPDWVTSLAGAGRAVADGDLYDPTCCRMVALQVADTMCCRTDQAPKLSEDYIEAIPVLAAKTKKRSVFDPAATPESEYRDIISPSWSPAREVDGRPGKRPGPPARPSSPTPSSPGSPRQPPG